MNDKITNFITILYFILGMMIFLISLYAILFQDRETEQKIVLFGIGALGTAFMIMAWFSWLN